jgi:ribose transport system permease protein
MNVRNPVAGPAGTDGVATQPKRFTVSDLMRDYGLPLAMLASLLVLGLVKPAILSPGNLASIVDQSAAMVIMSVGLAMVMMMRGVDLSVAQVADTAGVLAAMLLLQDQPIILVFLLPILFAVLVGLSNGFLMAYIGVPAIIGTLGMMFIVRALELVLSSGRQAQVLFTLPPAQSDPFFFVGQGKVGPVAVSIIVALIFVAAAHLISTSTTLGRFMAAVGGNVRAAFLAGVSHRVVFAAGFVISASMAAVAGILLASRAGIAQPGAFEPYLLNCFVAVYLGSALVPSGRINVIGTAIGALFVGLIGNALTLIGLGVPYRYGVYGAVILLAMAIGVLRRER